MSDDRVQLKEKLMTALDELQEEELEEVATYVDHLKEETKIRQSGNLRPGGMELIWRCTECGYLQTRVEQLPDQCPNCGAVKEAFVLVDED
jgi:rubrerythrin